MKQKKTRKVLVVATSRKTRGGITSVVKAHEHEPFWNEFHCRWIETHIDGSNAAKIWYFARALATFVVLLPWYDAVHIHLSAVVRKMVFFVIAKLMGKKTITHLHVAQVETSIDGKLKGWYRWMMQHSDRVIVLSEQWKRLLKELIQVEGNVLIVNNPCPTIDSSSTRPRRNVILYAGSIIERKGYADLIEAFARVAKKNPSWTLELAGNGQMDQARQLIERLGVTEQVKLLGWINGQQKHQAFSSARVFCLPSYAEGFPMAVLDAWAYGIPVVCTPVGGLPDIVKDGQNALVFACGNIDELALKLDTIMNDRALQEIIASRSLAFAATTFNLKTIGIQLGNIYSELLDKK